MITKLSQLEHDQMYLLCIHVEYVLVHDLIRWDLAWPQSISPTNQSYATSKGASSCVGATRAVLAERGCREPCWGRAVATSRAMAGLGGRAVATSRAMDGPGARGGGRATPGVLAMPRAPRAGRAGPPCRQATSSHRAGRSRRAAALANRAEPPRWLAAPGHHEQGGRAWARRGLGHVGPPR
jgi:hypothetical protein